MDTEVLKKYKKAGAIAAEALAYGARLVKPGNKIADIAEAIERKIVQLGGKPAFPVNISINDVAAHYSPLLNDIIEIKAEDYVKLDAGVHIDGWIGDTAITIRPAGKDELIVCSEKMLETALAMFRPGTPLADIGAAIEDIAAQFGFNSIRNLTGHGLAQFNLHAGVVVPNVKTASSKVLEEGEVYAVEPFCTPGSGWVKDGGAAMIFRWIADRPSRLPEARKILEFGKVNFSKLPFAKRWLQKEISSLKLELALKQLISSGAIYAYNVLKEESEKPVAQSEHTVIVADKPIITTEL